MKKFHTNKPEFGDTIAKLNKLGGAYEREIVRIEEKHQVLSREMF